MVGLVCGMWTKEVLKTETIEKGIVWYLLLLT